MKSVDKINENWQVINSVKTTFFINVVFIGTINPFVKENY